MLGPTPSLSYGHKIGLGRFEQAKTMHLSFDIVAAMELLGGRRVETDTGRLAIVMSRGRLREAAMLFQADKLRAGHTQKIKAWKGKA